MNPLIRFLQSAIGRWLRMAAGLVLIAAGVWPIGGMWGAVVSIVGLIPFVAGALGICLLAPFFGYNLYGKPRIPHA